MDVVVVYMCGPLVFKESLSFCLKITGVLCALSSGNGRGFAAIGESAIMDEDDAFDYVTLGVG